MSQSVKLTMNSVLIFLNLIQKLNLSLNGERVKIVWFILFIDVFFIIY